MSWRYWHLSNIFRPNFSNINRTAFNIHAYSRAALLPVDLSQGFVSVGYSLYYHFTVQYLTENFTCHQIPSGQPWQCYRCNSLITNTSFPFKYCFNLLSTMRLILEDFPEADFVHSLWYTFFPPFRGSHHCREYSRHLPPPLDNSL